MQSADQVEANGSHVSTAGFKTEPWYRIQCPATVLAALVKAGEYKDLYVGTNLSTIPRARFEQCWWYRCEFDVTDMCEVETTLLEFDGINYGVLLDKKFNSAVLFSACIFSGKDVFATKVLISV